MGNDQENMNPINMLLHAGMMIFTGIILAVTVNIVYGACLWIGAVACFAAARRKDQIEQQNDSCDEKIEN